MAGRLVGEYYYGRWKALHYHARRFYDDVLISPFLRNEKVDVYVVSDKSSRFLGIFMRSCLIFRGKFCSIRPKAFPYPRNPAPCTLASKKQSCLQKRICARVSWFSI